LVGPEQELVGPEREEEIMVRRFAIGRSMKTAPRERKPRKNRAVRFLVLTFGSGALAALLAIVIAGIPTVLGVVFPAGAAPEIKASSLFPPVQAVHKVIDVYDPPPPRAAPRPAPPVAAPVKPTAEPSQRPEPSQSPEPGDN
jgi:hypothetical protein